MIEMYMFWENKVSTVDRCIDSDRLGFPQLNTSEAIPTRDGDGRG